MFPAYSFRKNVLPIIISVLQGWQLFYRNHESD